MERPDAVRSKPVPILRSLAGGLLMGLANLVPGISGGTMILVVGLYDEFVGSLAEVSRLRFTRRNVVFLVLVAGAAFVAIAVFAGTLSQAVSRYPTPMYSLFIGLTLGGAPLLIGLLRQRARLERLGNSTGDHVEGRNRQAVRRPNLPVVLGTLLGFFAMVLLAMAREEPSASAREGPAPDAVDRMGGSTIGSRECADLQAGQRMELSAMALDFTAGALGMSAMVLPGVSGAYVLLLLGRYEPILAAVSAAKDYAASFGREGSPSSFLGVLVPVGVGAGCSLVLLSNLLKWLLRRYWKLTHGVLLGILLGAVVGIWPFHPGSEPPDYLLGAGMALAGFAMTTGLSRLRR